MSNLEFKTIDELHKYLIDNKKSLIAQKKSVIKEADSIPYVGVSYSADKDVADKAESAAEVVKEGEIQVKVVINTTNLIDSHMDCHMKGLWKKSLSEQKKLKLLKEHKATFENVVSDNVVATAKTMTWKSLGYDMEGSTQALIFDATIKEDRAPYMFGQYKNGYVDNHSVGMRYVTLYLCMNNDKSWAAEEKANWDKYYSEVANKEIADQYGYFWAVTEAKIVEGSAVVFGSNYITPTLSVKQHVPNDTLKTEPLITEEVSIDMLKSELKTLLKN